jgi:hypothetical protein
MAEFYFPRQTEAVVNQINVARPAGESIWRLLNSPFMSGFTVGVASGAVGMHYKGSANNSVDDSEEAAVRTTVNEGTTSASQVSAMSTDVLDGVNGAGTLTTVIVPSANRGTGVCGPPLTDPSTSMALSRHKRSLYANVPGFEEWLNTKTFSA